MAEHVTAVDADRLARPFLYFLLAILALGAVATLLAAARAVAVEALVTGFALLATVLVAVLAVALALAGRRHGIVVDPADALYSAHVQDLADIGIAAAASVTGVALLWRRGLAGPVDAPLLLAVALLAVAGVAVVRLFRVRLVVLDDAVLRVPASGLANRYPIRDLAAVQVRGPFLRVRTAVPLADWTCRVPDPREVAELIEGLGEELGEEE